MLNRVFQYTSELQKKNELRRILLCIKWGPDKIPRRQNPPGQNPPGQNPPGQNPPNLFKPHLRVLTLKLNFQYKIILNYKDKTRILHFLKLKMD